MSWNDLWIAPSDEYVPRHIFLRVGMDMDRARVNGTVCIDGTSHPSTAPTLLFFSLGGEGPSPSRGRSTCRKSPPEVLYGSELRLPRIIKKIQIFIFQFLLLLLIKVQIYIILSLKNII